MTTKVTKPHTGDQPKPQKNAVLAAMPLDKTTEANLKIQSNDVNDRNLSGKKLGSILVTENHSIVVALGDADTSKWRVVTTGLALVPTGGAKTSNGSIGDMRRKATIVPINSLSIPVVDYADMTTKSSPLNTSYLSGKKLGSVVSTEDGYLFIALGSDPADKWACSLGEVEDKVPTGDARPDYTSAIVGDSNRKVGKVPTITCVDFPVFPIAELQQASSSLNSDPQSGVVDSCVVIAVDAGEPDLYVSKGGSSWLSQTGGTEIIPA